MPDAPNLHNSPIELSPELISIVAESGASQDFVDRLQAGRGTTKRFALRRYRLGTMFGAIATVIVTILAVFVIASPSRFSYLVPGVAPDTSPTQASVNCPRRDRNNPAKFLSGIVNVGINGQLPGWSLGNNSLSGFDVDLARFLAARHHFVMTLTSLRPTERERALQTCQVDLVIANYSITDSRRSQIDFVGPYFLDDSGLFYSREKFVKKLTQSEITQSVSSGIPVSHICVTARTTAAAYLSAPGSPVVGSSLADCMSHYLTPDDPVVAVISDGTLLAAFAKSKGVPDSAMPVQWTGEGARVLSEAYGIGIPKDSPELCRVLSQDIDDFLTSSSGWDAAFHRNLASSQSAVGHKPASADLRICDAASR